MLEKINRKHAHGYLLYIVVDGVKINIVGWFGHWKNHNDHYQWIGVFV